MRGPLAELLAALRGAATLATVEALLERAKKALMAARSEVSRLREPGPKAPPEPRDVSAFWEATV